MLTLGLLTKRYFLKLLTEPRICSLICCRLILCRPSRFLTSVSVCESLTMSSAKDTRASPSTSGSSSSKAASKSSITDTGLKNDFIYFDFVHFSTIGINVVFRMGTEIALRLMAYSHWRFFQARSDQFFSRSDWCWCFV